MSETENPAETLREAAVLMRERAEAATEGPWEFEPEGDYECGEPGCCSDYWDNRIWGGGVVIAESHLTSAGDSTHIASWHPTVALRVAASLDQAAAVIDEAGSGPLAMAMNAIAEPLIDVARTYLGRPC